jgi:hypothetical protein
VRYDPMLELWLFTSRDVACCDFHFSNGLTSIEVAKFPRPPKTIDELKEYCPYYPLEREA